MFKNLQRRIFRVALPVLSGAILVAASPATKDADDPNIIVHPDLLSGLHYRLIGPFRGGRVTTVTGVPAERQTFYMGTTGGGVWKTIDGGETWSNITDGYVTVGSIGAISVAASDSNVVYVGTGSACPRGNISPGNGVYRSVDGGRTWQHLGLEKAGLIGKVEIDPNNPDIALVAVLGNIFGPNPERGVFRTLDGGKNWEKVLFVSDRTGAVDLAMNPSNPRILFAGMWRVERKPWTLIDGDEEGGLYRSVDGGNTWEKVEGGLPGGLLGRIGVAVSPADPDRIWVLQETAEEKDGGVYRSDDGGTSWQKVSRDHNIRQRAWYYNHIIADPGDADTVYVMNGGFNKSIDGGRNFTRVSTPHGDNHALWVNPHDSDVLINGNDGGANVSYTGGASWSTQLNQPTAEFYRVTVDNQYPYRVYGAQQDNTTLSLPSRMPGGITPKEHWFDVGGGESGHIAVDPRDPNVVYAGNYIGQITRLDRARGHQRDVVSYPQLHDGMAGRDIRYRFQWNAPIRISPHDPSILYHASQHVHRSRDGGQSWEVISPDLTSNKDEYQNIPGGPIQHDHTGVELYTTIFAFEESPQNAGELWAGSDDGLLHLSRDHGKSWQNITPPGMPAEGTINTIELSRHAAGRAYISVYKYRENDFHPYIFRTEDHGKTWQALADGNNGIPSDHWVRVVREDPDRKGLLYAGTEFGMFISFDDGLHWQEFQLNLPRTPITDLAVHEQDLVVATQGRSFWILDDLTPLHSVDGELAALKMHLFAPRMARRSQIGGFRSPNAPERPPSGALIYFYLGDVPASGASLEILDSSGTLARRYRLTASEESGGGGRGGSRGGNRNPEERNFAVKKGLNRLEWDFSYPEPVLERGAVMSLARTSGPLGAPGVYRAVLKWGEESAEQSFEVGIDPRWTATADDLKAQFDLAVKTRDLLAASHDAIRKIRSIRTQVQDLVDRVRESGSGKELSEAAGKLNRKLSDLEEELIQTRNESGQDPINYPPKLDNQIAYLFSIVNRQDARPTRGSYERYNDLESELERRTKVLDGLIRDDLGNFQNAVRKANIPPVVVP